MELQLKQIRKAQKITQKQMADLLGVDLKTIGNWELGRTTIKLDDACRICQALHCTPNDLCGWYIDHPDDAPRDVSPSLAPDETAVVEDYRTCTPEWRRNIRMNVKAAKAASLNVPQHAAPVMQGTA